MKLGLQIGYSGAQMIDHTELVKEAERLGYSTVWTAEAYGSDAVTHLTWYAAHTERINLATGIMQIPARTPAMCASTVATLDALSGGRVILGLGLSGPQVVEGFHGVPYGRPLARTREYVEIVRKFLARDEPVAYDGREYHLPAVGEGATGLGKPLRLILHPVRNEVPIYLGAEGPKNLEMTGEIADGWISMFAAPNHIGLYREPIERGLAKSGRTWEEFPVAASVMCIPGDDVSNCAAMVKPMIALYVGGMGAKDRNFHFDAVCRYGFEDAAVEIQDKYLAGDKAGAMAAVPDALCDEMSLLGPPERIRERLEPWEKAGIDELTIMNTGIDTIRTMAELVL